MMGRVLENKIGEFILFTDSELQKKFVNYIHTLKRLESAVMMACSYETKFDFGQQLNLKIDELPIANNEVINLRTLERRRREKKDLWSTTTEMEFTCYDKKQLEYYMEKCKSEEIINDYEQLDARLSHIFPKASQFISMCLANIDRRTFARRILGYSFSASVQARSHYWFYGKGSGGKSALFNSIYLMLGAFALLGSKNIVIKGAKGRASDHSSYLMKMKGKRMVYISETDKGDRVSDGLLKNVASGDRISARELFRAQEEFQPIAKIYTLTNNPAGFDSYDTSNMDRLKAVFMDTRFWSPTHDFKPHDWNAPDYKDHYDEIYKVNWIKITPVTQRLYDESKLTEDNGGFLNELFSYFALSCYEVFCYFDSKKDNYLPTPPQVEKDTAEFIDLTDLIKEYVSASCITVEDYHDGQILSEVFEDFKQFLHNREHKMWSRKSFAEGLAAKGLYHAGWTTQKGTHTRLTVKAAQQVIQAGQSWHNSK